MERRKQVLVVEDEVLVSEMICDALTEDGFDVHVSANADDALRYLSRHSVDVLFTDIDLPGSMDGGRLARCAREMKPDLPVIYASGKAPDSVTSPRCRVRSSCRSRTIPIRPAR